ncbi:hypothetical protein DFH08DRAFT_946742 [Mycena albidolilacea]|uniref:Uncharacterized protein n=1 Tax=Mycena albidolilacea TaxID=1033008 RepID=A0AAD7F459_9AGAR|nr:hypothetical protein DFH08DRAFT_946742 [Mycena albidolilacea]
MITPTDEKTIPQPQSIEIPRSQADMTQPQVAIPQPSTAGTTRFPTDPKVRPNPPPYNDLASQIPSAESNGGNVTEAEWKNKLKILEKKIRKYNWSKKGDEADIVESMRDLAASHNDPQVQAYWTRRATEFEKAPDSDKKAMLIDIGRGLVILIAAPFAIAGAILVGTGMLLKASGNFLTSMSGFSTMKTK